MQHFHQRPLRHSLIVFLLTLTLVLLGMWTLDLWLAYFFARPELAEVYYYSREVTNIGDSAHYFIIGLVGLVFAKVLYPRIPWLQKKIKPALSLKIGAWSGFLIKCLLLCGLVLHLIKITIGRQRPHVSENFHNLNFEPFNFHWHWQSFPSGHTQVLFTVGTVAALCWPRYRWVFLILALLFAFTRITIHQHFFSDVASGALVGYLVTLWTYRRWPPKH